MLKKANNLRKNDPYITDSLGWVYYKLKDFKKQNTRTKSCETYAGRSNS